MQVQDIASQLSKARNAYSVIPPNGWLLAGIHVSRWANGQSFNQFVARCKMVQGERHPSRRGELPCSEDVDDVVHDLQSIAIRRRPADVR